METENMDSFSNFYDLIEEHGSAKLRDQAEISEDGLPGLAELDPSVELSLDLQELIEGATTSKAIADTSLQLFPELLASCPEIDHLISKREQEQEDEHGDIATAEASLSLSQQVECSQLSTAHMTVSQEIDIEVPEVTDSACPVFTVKESDLVALGINPGNTDGIAYIKLEPIRSAERQVEVADTTSVTPTSTSEHHYTKPVGRNPLKSTSSASRSANSRRRQLEKGSDEYLEKRERNNVAVRKSRDKAKVRQKNTEGKVHELTVQNQQLQKKVDLLSKELAVLKGLFTNVGATIPKGLTELLD